MFQTERFIEDCCTALKERDMHAAIRELVAAAVGEPDGASIWRQSRPLPVSKT